MKDTDTLQHADLSALYLPTAGDKNITAAIIYAITEAVSDDDFVTAHYSKLRSLSFAINSKLQDMEAEYD